MRFLPRTAYRDTDRTVKKEEGMMENEKKAYESPEVEMIEFDFRDQVVASGGGGSAYCNSRTVWGTSYRDGRCWPVYTA